VVKDHRAQQARQRPAIRVVDEKIDAAGEKQARHCENGLVGRQEGFVRNETSAPERA
jgi:hypothetical protein